MLGNAVLCKPLAPALARAREWWRAAPIVAQAGEREQTTGSLKVRDTMLRACAAQRAGHSTFVAASTGNHALDVAHAARVLDLCAKLFKPAAAASSKMRALADATGPSDGTVNAGDVRVVQVAGDCLAAELDARAHAGAMSSSAYVSS